MTQTAEPTRLGAALRRQWIILVVAILIGLGAAYAFAGSKSSSKWKGTESVTVTQLPGGIVNIQRAGIVVTAASTSSVLRAAETSLGLAHGTLSGAVSAATTTADVSTMTTTVTAPSRAAAQARVKAVTAAAIDYVLAPYQGYFAVQESIAQASEAQARVLAAQIASLQRTASTVPVAGRAGYYSAIIAATSQRYNELTDAATARQKIEAIQASVYTDGVAHAGKTSARLRVATLVQGLLLGLIAGVAVALVREWLRTRHSAAAPPAAAPPAAE